MAVGDLVAVGQVLLALGDHLRTVGRVLDRRIAASRMMAKEVTIAVIGAHRLHEAIGSTLNVRGRIAARAFLGQAWRGQAGQQCCKNGLLVFMVILF
jgi:hypothetical protein